MAQFENKVAIVTGGGSGIGEAISMELADKGARVVVTDINIDAAGRVVEQITSDGGSAAAFQQDTSVAEQSRLAVEFAVETYGALHLAVNNAGIAGAQAPVGEVDTADWDKVIAINLSGVLYGMRYQIPQMLKAGAGHSAIVNMASVHAMVAALEHGAYTAAKHGVVGLTKNAAAEYGPRGLRINAIGPGYIRTPLLENALSAEARDELAAKHPLGRLGTPQDVAHLASFLLSEEAGFITGGYFLIDGGYTVV